MVGLKINNDSSWKEIIKAKKLDDDVVNLVIDAFSEGRNYGFEQAKSFEYKTLAKAFQDNLDKATTIASKIAAQVVTDFSTDIEGLFLKVETKTSFIVAIVLPLEFYVSENRRKLTELLIDLENENCMDTFNITFTVIPSKKELNFDKLSIDGYILRNEKYQRRN